MLFWILMGALLIGTIAYTVSYVITKPNILETIKNALENVANAGAKKALEKGFQAIVKDTQTNIVKLDVLIDTVEGKQEKLDITINCAGVDETVKNGMKLQCTV